MQRETVTRYVVTHINKDGMRTLTSAAQGRYTYETKAGAQEWIDAMLRNDDGERIAAIYGPQAVGTFEARPAECWAGNLDPCYVYFSETTGPAEPHFYDAGVCVYCGKAEPAPYCRPSNAGLDSEPRAVARRLSRLLTMLGTEVNSFVVDGQIADDVRNFRMDLHEKLTAEGWRISGVQNGWRVLPPKEDA